MKLLAIYIGVVLACTGGVLLAPAAPAHAHIAAPAETVLTLQPLQTLSIGQTATITAILVTSTGQPVVNRRIQFHLDDTPRERAWTDAQGRVSFQTHPNLVAGTHRIRAVFEGTPLFASSSAETELEITPVELRLRIVPAIEGVRFALDGRVFRSDRRGSARILVNQAKIYRLEALPWEDTSSQMNVQFRRWGDEVFVPYRDVAIPGTASLEVGFDVSQLVKLAFVDLASKPVDSARVDTVTIKSSHGANYTFHDWSPKWLQSRRVVRRLARLEESQIQYYVESVIIDEANLVNQGQQRFRVLPGSEWQIQLLLFSARFQAQDALFRFPVGVGIDLEQPDGRTEFIPFQFGGELTVHSLVRGLYRVRVAGAPGMATLTPIALSRDQDVQLLVISYLDMAIGILVAVGLALGFLLFGRPTLRRLLRNPRLSAKRLVGYVMDLVTPRMIRNAFRKFEFHLAVERSNASGLERRRIDPILTFATILLVVGTLAGLAGFRVSRTQAQIAQTNLLSASAAGNQRPLSEAAAEAQRTRSDLAAVGEPGGPALVAEPDQPAPPATPSMLPTATSPSAAPRTLLVFQRTLRLRSKGDDVILLQKRLRDLGYFHYKENTGYFGTETAQAVSQFQREHGLPETAEVDAATAAVLNP
jgi:hypothetical protein